MKISKEARRASRQLFRLCMVDGKLDETRVRQVVEKVGASKPRSYVGILNSFAHLVRSEVERQRAIVEHATDLDDSMKEQLRRSLSQKYNRDLQLEFVLKPELFGGVRVRVGSDVWDGSVKARLENLQAQLA
ncbi:MAG: F0F1 ATP synthase subunit delta [Verrucomicrobiales bacterium]|nr:F0F1 ATP synthase subunit delta [Verrucomicrobiales bacterium]